MKTRLFNYSILIVFVMTAGACRLLGFTIDSSAPAGNGAEVLTLDSFLSDLKKAGVPVSIEGEVAQPFFEVSGKVLSLDGAEVQAFEFPDAEASRLASESVAPDGGSVGTTMVTWLATPHFFKTDELIVLYVGDDPAVLKTIETIMGPQFAGG